jgi:hypothetical protein
MPTTPNFNLPYPEGADPVDVPGDMQALAEATDLALDGLDFSLDGLNDVTIATPTLGQVLRFNDSSGEWENSTDGSALTALNASNVSSGTLGAARLPAGSTLQVVQTVKTDTFTTTSATFGSVTGLSVAITPSSASSKVLVVAQVNLSSDVSGHIRISGGNAGAYVGNTAGSRVSASAFWGAASTGDYASNNGQGSTTIFYLDSPATTSQVTYQVEARRGSSGTAYVNRSSNEGDSANHARTVSSITAMEVAA